MRTPKLVVLALALVVGAVGCNVDLAGVRDADAYLARLTNHVQVEEVRCEALTVAVNDAVQCLAYGPNGTALQLDGVAVVLWGTSDNTILQVDLSGLVTGLQEGSAVVTATGPRNSSASVVIAVGAS